MVRPEHVRQPPSRGPGSGGRREEEGQGALGVRGRGLPLAAGAGRALLARASADCGLPGRGLREAPDGAAGGPAGGWAHVQVRHGRPGARGYGQRVCVYGRGASACAQTN
eukprot:15479390-Alexandrium_andersonii.AAC.1